MGRPAPSILYECIHLRRKVLELFHKDDETSSNDDAKEEDPKRSKVELASVASSSKDPPKQAKKQSAKAAPDSLQRFTYASSTEVKRFFLQRHYVKHGLSEGDKDAIKNKNVHSRGMGFNEEEKLFLVEEMREMQFAGLEATHIAQVRTIIQKGRKSKFLTETDRDERRYESQVQRYIVKINSLKPFAEARTEYMCMKNDAETRSVC